MADNKDDSKEEVKEEEMPVAVDDDAKDDSKEEAKDDKKDDDKKMPIFERIPKPFPGDYWKDQYEDKKDPRGEPSVIEFKWNKDFTTIDQCDTLHMLFLLQQACELHRRRVIERNKYFMSISRADRYIAHVDTPQIITNFIKWHNKDKENNVFTGDMIKTKKKLFMINDMISDVGGTKKGPATRIFTKLRKEVIIEHDQWTETGSTKQKLETWGLTKMYAGETTLEECTIDQVITLFNYVDESEDEKGDEPQQEPNPEEVIDGVFHWFEEFKRRTAKPPKEDPDPTKKAKVPAHEQLFAIDGWRVKFVEWIREEEVDGAKLKSTPNKEFLKTLRPKLEPDEKAAKRLNGPIGKMMNQVKKMPVHKVLEAAKAKKAQ